MSNISDPTPEQLRGWNDWVQSRPESVRSVASKLFPWKLYRQKSSGHRVTVQAFDEQLDGKVTLRVMVGGEFNLVAFERSVFGVDPEDLEECDLLASGEALGSANLSVEQCRKILDRLVDGEDCMLIRFTHSTMSIGDQR